MGSKQANVIRLWFLCLAIFLVGSVALTGCSGGSFVTTPAPTGVTAAGGDSQVKIFWTAVPGATSYNIYWSTTSGVTTANGTKISGVSNPYTMTALADGTKLTNGTTYYFVVTAVSSASSGTGESAPSAQVSCVANPVPTEVTAAAGDLAATISWTAVSGAISYNIYWSKTTGVTTANGTKITGATNPYTLTGLTNGTTYYFVVTAVNSSGESSPSTEATCIPALPVPTGVSATRGNGQATVSWPAVTGATSYNIYWSKTTGVTTANGTKIAGVTTPYVVTGLTNDTPYYFVVTEVNSDGESAPSAEVSATPTATPPPDTPAGVSATAGDLQATIAWSLVPNTDSYNIYWSSSTGVTTANGTKIAGATNPYIQTGRTNGTTYYYVVTAVNSHGESAPSAEVSCTPKQPVPQGVIATPAAGQATIAWLPVTPVSASDSVSSYNIYWSLYSGVTPLNGKKITGATSPDILTGLASGTYYFVVTDVIYNSDSKTSRESTASAQASATVP